MVCAHGLHLHFKGLEPSCQSLKKFISLGVPVVAQWKRIRLGPMRWRVRSLASLRGLRIRRAVSCGVGRRCGSDPALLWLWHRLAAIAPVRPLALGTSICHRNNSRKGKKKKEEAPQLSRLSHRNEGKKEAKEEEKILFAY